MNIKILTGDWIDQLCALPDKSIDCCVTSPPYWGLRDYGTAKWIGGDELCQHEGSERYYTERTASVESSEAFSESGEANAERVKKARWRNEGTCIKCGAVKIDRQLGLEKTPDEYIGKMVSGFREVQRVLKDSGTVWINLGDSYNAAGRRGHGTRIGFKQESNRASATKQDWNRPSASKLKPKDLIGIPWRVAFALQADGWYLRSDIIWHKPNPMPESVTDRPTKSHEYIFLLSKNERYFYDAEAIKENSIKNGKVLHGCGTASKDRDDVSDTNDRRTRIGLSNWKEPCPPTRNKRTVWTVNTAVYSEAHFATFPPDLIKPCILAGCPVGGTVLDPFFGSGTTGQVALELGRNCIGIELNPKYVELANHRTNVTPGLSI